MILRLVVIQALLLAGIAALQLHTGFLTAGATGLAATVALGLYVAAMLFLAWKFILQPRLNRFRFNQSQDPDRVEAGLAGFPTFYDTAAPGFGWVGELERQAPAIIAEIRAFLAAGDGATQARFRTAYNNTVLSLSQTWKTLNLLSYGAVNSELLPRTQAAITAVPNVFNCNLSKLGARSEVKPHAGESTCYIRCHLGIDIPAAAPTTAFQVGGDTASWREGKVLAFCDAHWHAAHNHSDRDRYVLIFDLMPAWLGWYTPQFCALMVAFDVTQHVLPGRVSLDEPIWRPPVLLGTIALATIGTPLLAVGYLYFRYLTPTRPRWVRRLGDAGFGFYY